MTLYGWNMFLGSLATVKRLRQSFNFSVIDAHFLYPDAFAAVLLGKVMKKPVIVSARGSDVHSYAQLRGIRPLLRFVLSRAAAVIAVCQALKDMMIQLGIAEEKIQVIGNGIDPSLFYPCDPIAARRQLGLPLDKTLILSVARITEVKGIHCLIDAVARVRQRRPDVQLVLVGSSGDKVYSRRLQEQVERRKLTHAVHFTGPQLHGTLRDWYNACDLFCLASAREGWPNVLLEAMACGKPIVASHVGGVPEVVASSDYGVLVDPPDSEAFAAAILSALHKRWNREKLVSHARTYSWDQVAATMERLFQRIVFN